MVKSTNVLTAMLVAVFASQVVTADESPEDVFAQRIMPIFRSPNPSSCVQCHLASVDLKDYILPSAAATFTSLRDQGLVDLDTPKKSKILRLIQMGADDSDAASRLRHQKTRDAERAAFESWIVACCADPGMRGLPAAKESVAVGPAVSDDVIRHARKDRLLDSFVRNVWSQRMRCFPCHTPNEIDSENPKHKKPAERHADFQKRFGQRINLFRETPLKSMNAMIASSEKKSGRGLPLINVQSPIDSLLVLKPTARLPKKGEDDTLAAPSSVAPVSHLGGLKMHLNDQSYKSFVAWIDDYAKIRGQHYKNKADLPADNWFPTQYVLRIKDTPGSWEVGAVVQVFLHARDGGSVSSAPVAFTQGTVTPRKFVNGALTLLDATGVASERESKLKRTQDFEVRVFVDHDHEVMANPSMLLNHKECDAESMLTTEWEPGFRNAVVISGSDLKIAVD